MAELRVPEVPSERLGAACAAWLTNATLLRRRIAGTIIPLLARLANAPAAAKVRPALWHLAQ